MVYDRSRYQSEVLGRVWTPNPNAEIGPLFARSYLQAVSAIR